VHSCGIASSPEGLENRRGRRNTRGRREKEKMNGLLLDRHEELREKSSNQLKGTGNRPPPMYNENWEKIGMEKHRKQGSVTLRKSGAFNVFSRKRKTIGGKGG